MKREWSICEKRPRPDIPSPGVPDWFVNGQRVSYETFCKVSNLEAMVAHGIDLELELKNEIKRLKAEMDLMSEGAA